MSDSAQESQKRHFSKIRPHVLVAIVTAGHSHTEATGGDEPRSGAKYTVYVGLREDKPAVDVRRETAGDR